MIIVNNGTNYTVDVLGGNNVTNEGTLQIDGIPTVVKKGDFKTIDGLPVFIKEIFISNSPPFVSINFSYGVQKLELQYAVSGGQVKLDNNVLDEVTLSVNQSGVQKWVGVNRLTFTVTPKDAQDQVNYLLNGSEYTDPLFGKFKFHFVGATDLSLGKEPFSLQQFGSILELTFMPKGATSPTTLFLLDNNSYYSDFVNASTLANLKVSDEFIYNEYPGYADKAVTHLLQITLIQNANNISNANFSALVYDVSFDKFYNVTHCAAVDSRIALYPAPGSDANHLTLTNDSDCDVITNGSAFKNLPQIYANAGARIEFLNSTNGTIANASQIPTGIGYINVTEDAQHDAQASTATSFVLKYSWNATAGAYSVTLANPGTATGNIGNDDLRNFWLSKFGTYVVADKNATPFKFVNMYIPARESTYDMFLMPPDGTLRTVIPSVTVDGAAPTINITSPVNNTVQPDSNVTLTFSASDGNGLDKCWYELSGANTTISCSSLSKTVMLANGAYNITFYANDTFGKSSSKKYNFTVTDTTAPSITGGTVTKTTTTADIPWTSNELLYKVRVYYGLDSSLDETPISVTNPSGTSGTVSLDSLSNGRTYYYIIEACDADTHTLCANTSQASFTTNHASSSGGGGGGGGSSSSTPASSNAFYATTFDQVLSGSTNLTLTSIVIAFNQLTITTNVNTANVKFTVQALADSPHAYTMPVFQYLEVNHTNLDDSSINGVKIKFTVPKSWLTSNNIASSDVRLVRYYNGIWTPLSTTKQSEDTTNVYYQADSPGLSLYAISTQSAQQSAPVVNTTNTTNTTAVVTPTTPTPTTPTTPEATPTTPTSASGSNAWIIIVIIVVVAIAAIVIFIVYKKKKV